MDKKEAAKLLLDAVKLMGTLAKLIDPRADHFTGYCNEEGHADFTVWAGDKEILDGHCFPDGDLRLNKEYIWKEDAV